MTARPAARAEGFLTAALAALLFPALLLGADAQGALTPRESVHVGLTLMTQVVVQSGSLIAARSYDQLPEQNARFEQGLATLRHGITGEPAERRQQLDRLLAKARVAASGMSEAARTRNDAMLKLTHDQLATAVKAIAQDFPQELQPTPGAAPP